MSISHRFGIGFLVGLLIFIALNLLAAQRLSDCGLAAVFQLDACNDDIARAGFPLQFYEAGGFAYRLNFNPVALILDAGSGLLLSVLTGWLFTKMVSRRGSHPR